MNPASFLGQLLGVTLGIWVLFFRKRAIPTYQKWAFSFGLSLLFLLAMTGVGVLIQRVEPEAERRLKSTLETALHKQEGGRWEIGVGTSEDTWRFVSHRELVGALAERRGEVGMTAVKGSYRIDWFNETDKEYRVSYDLRFLDSNDLEIARSRSRPKFVLPPTASRETSGTFEIRVDNIHAANLVEWMDVFASFDEVDTRQ